MLSLIYLIYALICVLNTRQILIMGEHPRYNVYTKMEKNKVRSVSACRRIHIVEESVTQNSCVASGVSGCVPLAGQISHFFSLEIGLRPFNTELY